MQSGTAVRRLMVATPVWTPARCKLASTPVCHAACAGGHCGVVTSMLGARSDAVHTTRSQHSFTAPAACRSRKVSLQPTTAAKALVLTSLLRLVKGAPLKGKAAAHLRMRLLVPVTAATHMCCRCPSSELSFSRACRCDAGTMFSTFKASICSLAVFILQRLQALGLALLLLLRDLRRYTAHC